jgi:hypothetical protein
MRGMGCARPTRARGRRRANATSLSGGWWPARVMARHLTATAVRWERDGGRPWKKVRAVAAERSPVAVGCAGVWCHDQTRAALVATRCPLQGGGRRRPQTATNHPDSAKPVPLGECVPARGLKLSTPFGLRVAREAGCRGVVLFSSPRTGADRSTRAASHGVNRPTGWRGPNDGEALNDCFSARAPATPWLARRLQSVQHKRRGDQGMTGGRALWMARWGAAAPRG